MKDVGEDTQTAALPASVRKRTRANRPWRVPRWLRRMRSSGPRLLISALSFVSAGFFSSQLDPTFEKALDVVGMCRVPEAWKILPICYLTALHLGWIPAVVTAVSVRPLIKKDETLIAVQGAAVAALILPGIPLAVLALLVLAVVPPIAWPIFKVLYAMLAIALILFVIAKRAGTWDEYYSQLVRDARAWIKKCERRLAKRRSLNSEWRDQLGLCAILIFCGVVFGQAFPTSFFTETRLCFSSK